MVRFSRILLGFTDFVEVGAVKRSQKQLPTQANFNMFLQLNCFNFRLKLFERS